MHLNISSQPYHFDEFSRLLNDLMIKFKIIGITESRLRSEKVPITDISLPNYEIVHMPTKANKVGAVLQISNKLKCKVRSNSQIHKNKKLESIFIEVISQSQKNVVIGCIYKYPNVAVTKFNECYLQPLLDRLSLENNNVVVMGDFNVDLLHYETYIQSRDFLYKMFAASLKPLITTPTQITPQSKILIDNICTNFLDEDIECGNLTCFTSDHLSQFLIYTNKVVSDQKLYTYIYTYIYLSICLSIYLSIYLSI